MKSLLLLVSAVLAASFLMGCFGRSSAPVDRSGIEASRATTSASDAAPSGRDASDTTAFDQKASDSERARYRGHASSSVGSASDVGSSDTLDLPETNYYEIRVPAGRMVIRLYDETPRHRDNFKKLVEEDFFDGTTFHRVIEGFMIQGGDPYSRDDNPYNDGHGDPGYTVPAEIVPELFHKRGAVAAARRGDAVNPERRSSGSQFYIVQGSVHDEGTLDQIERAIRAAPGMEDFEFTEAMRRTYGDIGGAPNLDGQYTVFGEIVEGLDVLDAVASGPTPRKDGRRSPPQLVDRPFEDVPMTIAPLADYAP